MRFGGQAVAQTVPSEHAQLGIAMEPLAVSNRLQFRYACVLLKPNFIKLTLIRFRN